MDKWMISVLSVRIPCFPSTQPRNQMETSELVSFTTSDPTCQDFESQVLKSQPETSSEIVPGMLNQKCHNPLSHVYFLRFPRSLGGFGCHKFVFTHDLRVGKFSTDKCVAQRSAIVCQANIETFFPS